MAVTTSTLAERPELADRIWIRDAWPEFVQHDPVSQAYFGRIAETFPGFTVVATDEEGEVVARGHSVPFALGAPGRGALPARGWDQVLMWAFADHRLGRAPDAASAIDITVRTDRLGRGLSSAMLGAMREAARGHGLADLYAPVRPTDKHLEPLTPMPEYARRTRPDGLPADPWLRTHVRAGGTIESVAPASMVVTASLTDWRAWTGAPFTAAGPTLFPGALTPAHCFPNEGYAVYVEPNVWVGHALTPRRPQAD